MLRLKLVHHALPNIINIISISHTQILIMYSKTNRLNVIGEHLNTDFHCYLAICD